MKKLAISDSETVILMLQDEIRRSDHARYDHRLHAVLLVAQGMSCRGVAQVLGDAPRTVENWIHRFEEHGLAGLADRQRSGRPPRLSAQQMDRVSEALRTTPQSYGLQGQLWDGKILSKFIAQEFEIQLSTRQCQRLFRQLGFRLRKPRPKIAHADPDLQAEHKKNSR